MSASDVAPSSSPGPLDRRSSSPETGEDQPQPQRKCGVHTLESSERAVNKTPSVQVNVTKKKRSVDAVVEVKINFIHLCSLTFLIILKLIFVENGHIIFIN